MQVNIFMKKGSFDASAFFSALDAERISRKLNWKQVADQSKVSASTLTRMGQGKRPDVDSLASLANWSGLEIDNFIRDSDDKKQSAEPLAVIFSYLHADKNLTDEGAIALEELIKATYERLRKKDGTQKGI